MIELASYLGLGALAGVLAGLLGVGGGLVIVPGLIFVFGWLAFDPGAIVHLAVGTSLATMVFTGLSSVGAHHRRGAVRWDLFRRMAPGLVVGALVGAALADQIPGAGLKRLVGGFALLAAAQLALGRCPAPHRGLPRASGLTVAGAGIGTVSALIGIGGGSMTVPLLVWCNVTVQRAVATSAACGLPIALAGTFGFVWAGWGESGLPAGSLGHLYLPAMAGIAISSVLTAPLGARWAHALPSPVLQRGFALFLAVVALRLLTG